MVASLAGLAYALLVPPFQSPDETAHFLRTAHVASGHLMGTRTSDQRLGGQLPKSLPQLYAPFSHLRYDYEAKASKSDFQAAWQIPLNARDTAFTDFPNVGYYAPFPYLFQATIFRLFMVFDSRPLLLLYVGRLATLLIWLLLVASALRILPQQKWTLAWLALLPSSLTLHASLTGDAVTNGLCFWLLAAMLSLIFSEKKMVEAPIWVLFGIFISSAIVTLSKPVYFPLVLLAWLIPKGKFSHPSRFFAFAGAICLVNLALLAWWYSYAGSLFIPYGDYNPAYREGVQLNEGVQPHEQLAYVLEHPIVFLKTAALSYFESGPATLAHYFGKFGWEKNYLPGWLICLLLLATAWLGATDATPVGRLKTQHRLGFAAIALAMMGALALVLYMQWMPVGSERVSALSGRYFFPVFPLFFFGLGGLFIRANKKWEFPAIKALLILSLAIGAWEIVMRYYI